MCKYSLDDDEEFLARREAHYATLRELRNEGNDELIRAKAREFNIYRTELTLKYLKMRIKSKRKAKGN